MKITYAGFWLRLVAIIIDGIIIGCLQSIVIIPIFVAMGFGFFSGMNTMDMGDPENFVGLLAAFMAAMGAYWILAMVLNIVYFSFMESSKYQATLGKMALGIIVTDMEGNKLDFGKAFIRNLCKVISNMTFTIGYIIAGFTEKQQALHDILAKTLVIKKPATANAGI
ncbi:MAG: RDD family protein [Bacteroidota bacterium]